MQTTSRLFALTYSLVIALADEQVAASFSLPVQTGSFIFAVPSSQSLNQPRPPRPPRSTRQQSWPTDLEQQYVLPIPADVAQLDNDHTLFVPVGYRAPAAPPPTPAQAAAAARAERAVARAQRQRLQSSPYLPPANLLMSAETAPPMYQTPYVASIFRYGEHEHINDSVKEEEVSKDELQEVKETSTPAPVAEGAASEPTTVYERPVIVEKHGGPLVIIQQGRESYYLDAEQGPDAAKKNDLSNVEQQEPRTPAPTQQSFDRYNENAERNPLQQQQLPQQMPQQSQPVEYVPYAVISRDGRIALLERAPMGASKSEAAQATQSYSRREEYQPEPQKQFKAQPEQQPMRGNYYDAPAGQQQQQRGRREIEEVPRDQMPSFSGTSVVIRMPSDDGGAEWNPSAMLLGKAAHLRRAKELVSAEVERTDGSGAEEAEGGDMWHPLDSANDLED